jgi:hypothetical protein
MNCEKDDIAVMVHSEFPENVGTMYRILQLDRWAGGDWKCELLTSAMTQEGPANPGEIVWALDADLRPIRNSGEDAKDETLQWKEVPAKQKEPA